MICLVDVVAEFFKDHGVEILVGMIASILATIIIYVIKKIVDSFIFNKKKAYGTARKEQILLFLGVFIVLFIICEFIISIADSKKEQGVNNAEIITTDSNATYTDAKDIENLEIDKTLKDTIIESNEDTTKTEIEAYYSSLIEELSNGMKNQNYLQVVFSSKQGCIFCLKKDGTIRVIEPYSKEKSSLSEEYSKWTEVKSISLIYDGNIVGITYNGKVRINSTAKYYSKIAVSDWDKIIQVVQYSSYTIMGLTREGKINCDNVTSIGGYNRSIIESITGCIKVLDDNFIGITMEGRILNPFHEETAKKDGYKKKYIEEWKNIKDIVMTGNKKEIIGLTYDGNVLYGGFLNESSEDEMLNEETISSWNNIKSIAAGNSHLVALKEDGTVYAIGNNTFGKCDVDNWTNIERIEAYNNTTVGYKSDGSIVVAGENPIEQLDALFGKNE